MQIGDTFCEGLLKYSVVSATEVAVKGFADDLKYRNAKTLLIPVRVRGMSVVTITKEAFAQSRLEEVDIPETITVIGTEAFASCYRLRYVHFKKRDAKKTILIDERAFIACPYLVKVLSEDKSAVVQLSIHAFQDCVSLELFEPLIRVMQEEVFIDCCSLFYVQMHNPAYFQKEAFLRSSINSIGLESMSTLSQNTQAYIRDSGIIIKCNPNSPITDAVYEGYTVDVD